MPSSPPPRLALIACRVLETELAHFLPQAPHVVRTEFLDVGLHDRPGFLHTALAAALARAEDDPAVEAVALVYGVCGLGTMGLRPARCPLVLPRAHDCLTLFLGSKERYADIMRRTPDVYWYTPGWNRARRVPGPDREAALRSEYTKKFGVEDAEALIAMERASFFEHGRAVYTDFGLPDSAAEKAYAQTCATWLGWPCEEQPGDSSLLRALLAGEWDAERFLVVPPGQQTAFSADTRVVKAVATGLGAACEPSPLASPSSALLPPEPCPPPATVPVVS
ncbi:DUF1638 domain-containing protein [Opitutus terrae]|uniref:DUF1638 domain-containing protein n=1 Tax=Opitutus terrae (strain DSM 11246 / JCM 15787 / PB90-1) TaxID=452637 RepID=B1ZXD8_OPITP|nr:DUF1638 domain-containing protein [Opitutus terrae]ACB76933.1 hypothetical protein Oter_3656 [Opitutus terrae PB90-1]